MMPADSRDPTRIPRHLVILVVEDAADLRSSASEYLRIAGFEVVETEDAKAARAVIDSGMHVDLMFTDVNMPGSMDGVGLAHWVSEHRRDLPIILTSGEFRPVAGLPAPHQRFVRKPYMMDELEHQIRELIETSPVQ